MTQDKVSENALLVALQTKNISDSELHLDLEELAFLASSAGANVVHRAIQKRKDPDSATFIGKGKAREIAAFADEMDCNVVIFDNNLSPAQARNLSDFFHVKVIDRTQLILDIFAQRARTKEGKLQVELAQLQYLLPRLVGQQTEMMRQSGGIGTKGPGEKKLEVQRRRINDRIALLKRELTKVKAKRHEQRKRRKAIPVPVVGIVGYTNAGKSTLLNTLTNAGVLAENKLFATLDPTTRRVVLPDKRVVLFSDTVGFINKLPHTLIAAFRATLEEVCEADILIHVIDIAHPDREKQIDAVHEVLRELDVFDKPILNVFNKIDQVSHAETDFLVEKYQPSVAISALRGHCLNDLLRSVSWILKKEYMTASIFLPYEEYSKVQYIFSCAEILQQKHEETGIYMQISMPKRFFYLIKNFEVDDVQYQN